jgi:hypothetical protein
VGVAGAESDDEAGMGCWSVATVDIAYRLIRELKKE